MYGYGIRFTILQEIGNINLETHVTIVCPSYLASVEIDRTGIVHAIEVQKTRALLWQLRGIEGPPVPQQLRRLKLMLANLRR